MHSPSDQCQAFQNDIHGGEHSLVQQLNQCYRKTDNKDVKISPEKKKQQINKKNSHFLMYVHSFLLKKYVTGNFLIYLI